MRPKAPLRSLTVCLLVVLALPACVHRRVEVAQPVAVEAVPPPYDETAPAQPVSLAAPLVAVQVGGPYAPAIAPHDMPYLLDSGDRLRVQVFGQEGLTNSYIVDSAGYIAMPLIGTVPARGLTTPELGRQIAARLRNGFIRQPSVSVEVEVYRPFFILGEVNAPGQYPFVPNMTVEAAVAIAGGFAPRANKRDIRLSRNFSGEIMRGQVPADYPMRPGDTITVRERWF
jgi:polysaccharide biosynthesis/export protein